MIAGMQQLAAEKKLLKAEVASLKRQAIEQLATLRMLQKEYDQVKLALTPCANTSILRTWRTTISAWTLA